MTTIKKVAVIGAGLMGNGIAQVAAQAGYEVAMSDINNNVLERGLNTIRQSLDMMLKKGKLSDADVKGILSRIKCTTSVKEAAGDADIVIEAIPEDLGLKHDMFRKLDEICPAHTILASNTSTISITAIACVTKRPQSVIGLHFANPVPVMAGVEMIRGLETSDEIMAAAKNFVASLKKESYVSKDSPGFIGNRILPLLVNEAFNLLWEGVASAEDIDKATKLSFRHPMGPLELADLIGLDQLLKGLEQMHKEVGERYRPSPMLKQYVAAGYFGRKTGRGVYKYS